MARPWCQSNPRSGWEGWPGNMSLPGCRQGRFSKACGTSWSPSWLFRVPFTPAACSSALAASIPWEARPQAHKPVSTVSHKQLAPRPVQHPLAPPHLYPSRNVSACSQPCTVKQEVTAGWCMTCCPTSLPWQPALCTYRTTQNQTESRAGPSPAGSQTLWAIPSLGVEHMASFLPFSTPPFSLPSPHAQLR